MPTKSTLKIIIIGEGGSGKSSLIRQYLKREYLSDYKPTVGTCFETRDIQQEDRLISIQLWDTAGLERFASIGKNFYKNTHLCVLVFDITNMNSFKALMKWKEEFLLQAMPSDVENFPFIVIGNKCDREKERKVLPEQAAEWCVKNGVIPYFETSSKDGTNVEQVFLAVVYHALRHMNDHHTLPNILTLSKTINETLEMESPRSPRQINDDPKVIEQLTELVHAIPHITKGTLYADIHTGTGTIAKLVCTHHKNLTKIMLIDSVTEKVNRAKAGVEKIIRMNGNEPEVAIFSSTRGQGQIEKVNIATMGNALVPMMVQSGCFWSEGKERAKVTLKDMYVHFIANDGTLLISETLEPPLQLCEFIGHIEGAGFINVEVMYRYRNLVVIRAKK